MAEMFPTAKNSGGHLLGATPGPSAQGHASVISGLTARTCDKLPPGDTGGE